MIAGRPVEWRASLMAPSTASVPEFDRNTRFLLGPGASCASLAQRREALVVEVRAADMKEARRSVLDGFHHLRMAVARGCDRDTRHEVEEPVAVDVLDHRPRPARHGERILLGIGRRGKAVLPLDDRAGLGTRWRHDDAGVIASCGHARTFSFESVFSSAVVSRPTISSISGSVMMNGGAINAASPLVPSACPTFGQTVMPAASAASANRSANFADRENGARLPLSSTNSMPARSPRPRTSPTCGRSASNRSRSCNTRPIWAQRSTSLCCLRYFIVATPAAQDTG